MNFSWIFCVCCGGQILNPVTHTTVACIFFPRILFLLCIGYNVFLALFEHKLITIALRESVQQRIFCAFILAT